MAQLDVCQFAPPPSTITLPVATFSNPNHGCQLSRTSKRVAKVDKRFSSFANFLQKNSLPENWQKE
jgi:hypothetical protein